MAVHTIDVTDPECWEGRDGKRQNDTNLRRIIRTHCKRKTIDMLTLPAADWCFERALLLDMKHAHFRMVGIEMNPRVHRKARRMAARLGEAFPAHRFTMTERPMSAWDFIRRGEGVFDVVYLDWMGTWSQDKKRQVTALLEHKMIKNRGLLFTTIMVPRGQRTTLDELMKYLPRDECCRDTRAAKTRGLENLIISLGKKRGYDIECLYCEEYKDTQTPEISHAFKIRRKQ